MKFSEAMLKGYEMVGGVECHDGYFAGGTPRKPVALCPLGACNLAVTGNALGTNEFLSMRHPDVKQFRRVWGEHVMDLNEAGMPWEHIYGMAVAAGL